MSKLWDKGTILDKQVESFTVGEDYLLDQRLVPHDCRGSIAHARMLGKIGLLKPEEVQQLVAELNTIIALDKKGQFPITQEQEDCSTVIENHLTQKLGTIGGKIHTARSRNDQIITTLRLYSKEELQGIMKDVDACITALKDCIKINGTIQLPGYTHMRKAMPSSVGLWAGCFVESMNDNKKFLDAVLALIDQNPLGTAAGYGAPIPVDRAYTTKELGFAQIQENPIYVQHSRGKFEATILHALCQVMFDLNKLATDLILFSMPEFGYFELPTEFCTGSSIMPQKKNPDVLEILRAQYHIIVGYQTQVQSLIGNLPSGYNRDFQLTKGPLMKGFDITKQSLEIAVEVIRKLRINKDRCEKAMTSELFATAEAYKLVKQGMPFREAYKVIGKKFA